MQGIRRDPTGNVWMEPQYHTKLPRLRASRIDWNELGYVYNNTAAGVPLIQVDHGGSSRITIAL